MNNHEQKILVPMILSKLVCHKGQKNAIKSKDLISYCESRGEKITGPRIRKIIEHIRQRNLLDGLIARQFGYFIAESPEEILQWVETMKKRRNAIEHSIKAGINSYNKLIKPY